MGNAVLALQRRRLLFLQIGKNMNRNEETKIYEVDRSSRIAKLLMKRDLTPREISKATGTDLETVNGIKLELEQEGKLEKTPINKKLQKHLVLTELEKGKTMKEVMEDTQKSRQYILKVETMTATAPGDKERRWMMDWLLKNWRWKRKEPDSPRKRYNPKTGYRVVRKGEKGSLRTPYRPDRIWR